MPSPSAKIEVVDDYMDPGWTLRTIISSVAHGNQPDGQVLV
jgi:hypothetical protein